MKKDEFIKLHQSYLNEYIKFADAKALAIISINGFILNFNFSKHNIKFHNTEDIFNFVAFILLIITIILAAFAVYPRTNNRSEKGIIFWDNINSMGEKEFIDKVKFEKEEELLEMMIQQNYFLAKTASMKYSIIRKVFIISALGYFCLLFSSIFQIICS